MNPIRDIKKFTSQETNKVMALLWLVEATLLISVFA